MSLSFDPAALRELAALLNDSGLAEIELEEGDRRLRLARAVALPTAMAPNSVVALTEVAAAPAQGSAQIPAQTPAQAAAQAAASGAADLARHPGAVKSPMVGVAYLSPEPGAAPFVSIGQSVAAGETLLLIEAMKTFNQIKAPQAGTVARILIGGGQPVEYDEPLMILE